MKRQDCWHKKRLIALCCGCLPWLLLIKVLLALILPLILFPPIVFLLALFASPLIFFHAYWSVLATPRLGVEIKAALFFLLIVPILIAPVAALVLSPFYVIGITAFEVIASTVEDGKNLWIGGFAETYQRFFGDLKAIARELFVKVKDRGRRLREPEGAYNRYGVEHPAKAIGWIFVGLATALAGSLLFGLLAIVNYVFKILPLTIVTLIAFARLYFEECSCLRGMLFLFWLIAELLLIALVPIAGLLCVGAAFVYGLWGFTVPFRYELKGVGWWLRRDAARLENSVNDLLQSLGGCDCTCFHEFEEPDFNKLERRHYHRRVEVN